MQLLIARVELTNWIQVSTAWGLGLIVGPSIGGYLAQVVYKYATCLVNCLRSIINCLYFHYKYIPIKHIKHILLYIWSCKPVLVNLWLEGVIFILNFPFAKNITQDLLSFDFVLLCMYVSLHGNIQTYSLRNRFLGGTAVV